MEPSNETVDTTINKDLLARKIAESVVQGVLGISPEIDKFSSWFLAGSAASIVLILTSLKSLVPTLNQENLRLIIAVLGISVMFGLAQKYKAFSLAISRRVEDIGNESFERFLQHYVPETQRYSTHSYQWIKENIDYNTMMIYLITAFPNIAQKRLVKHLAKREGSLKQYQSEFWKLFRQAAYCFLQVISGIAAIIAILCTV